MSITITDTATPAIKRLASTALKAGLLHAAGQSVRDCVGQHLRELEPNGKFPANTTGFYIRAAESMTEPVVSDDRVTFSIPQTGMSQRYFGGPINPTAGHKYLTIPAQGLAYGHNATDFLGDLKFAVVTNEDGYLAPALVAGQHTRLKGSKQPRRKKGDPARATITPDSVLYWLVTHVDQKPDPDVLPTPSQIQTAAIEGMRNFARTHLNHS